MARENANYRGSLFLLAAFAVAFLSGCGGIKRVPVSGMVTLDGKPLAEGLLSFTADDSKGNTVRASCTGVVRSGEYTLQSIGVTNSESGPGVAPGWYKVTLVTDRPGAAKVKVAPKFTNIAHTPLAIEVVDQPAPGAYDLRLTSK